MAHVQTTKPARRNSIVHRSAFSNRHSLLRLRPTKPLEDDRDRAIMHRPHVRALLVALALPLASCLRQPVGTRARAAPVAAAPAARSNAAAHLRAAAAAVLIAGASALPAFADGDTETFKFPPIDRKNANRCRFVSSAMGQANAARDSLYDLRECNLDGKSAADFDISGALLAQGSFKKTNFKNAQLSKARAGVPDARRSAPPVARRLSPPPRALAPGLRAGVRPGGRL